MTSRFARTSMAIAALGALLGLTLPAQSGGHCPDATGDNIVNVDDLIAVILAWGPCPREPAECPANVTNSGPGSNEVNVDDLIDVILHFGEEC